MGAIDAMGVEVEVANAFAPKSLIYRTPPKGSPLAHRRPPLANISNTPGRNGVGVKGLPSTEKLLTTGIRQRRHCTPHKPHKIVAGTKPLQPPSGRDGGVPGSAKPRIKANTNFMSSSDHQTNTHARATKDSHTGMSPKLLLDTGTNTSPILNIIQSRPNTNDVVPNGVGLVEPTDRQRQPGLKRGVRRGPVGEDGEETRRQRGHISTGGGHCERRSNEEDDAVAVPQTMQDAPGPCSTYQPSVTVTYRPSGSKRTLWQSFQAPAASRMSDATTAFPPRKKARCSPTPRMSDATNAFGPVTRSRPSVPCSDGAPQAQRASTSSQPNSICEGKGRESIGAVASAGGAGCKAQGCVARQSRVGAVEGKEAAPNARPCAVQKKGVDKKKDGQRESRWVRRLEREQLRKGRCHDVQQWVASQVALNGHVRAIRCRTSTPSSST